MTRYTEMSSGYLSEAKAKFKSRNHLVLIAFGDAGWFFFNGQLLKKLDFRLNEDAGWISAVGSYYEDETGSIEFEDFNVWVP